MSKKGIVALIIGVAISTIFISDYLHNSYVPTDAVKYHLTASHEARVVVLKNFEVLPDDVECNYNYADSFFKKEFSTIILMSSGREFRGLGIGKEGNLITFSQTETLLPPGTKIRGIYRKENNEIVLFSAINWTIIGIGWGVMTVILFVICLLLFYLISMVAKWTREKRKAKCRLGLI